jgi:arylsulfatase A-like enzyme
LRRRRFLRQKDLGIFPSHARLPHPHPESYPWEEADQDDMDLRMAVYAALGDRVDQGICRILDTLREFGQ